MRALLTRRPWLSWAVVLGCLAIIGYLGITLAQTRAHQQNVRRIVANTLWFSVYDATLSLKGAEQSLTAGHVADAITLLQASDLRLRMTTRYMDTYHVLIAPTMNQESTMLRDTLFYYQFEPNRLWATLKREDAPPPADLLSEVTALRMDLERWQASFTEDLLTTGSRDQLSAAARIFCQDLRLPDMQDLTCHF